MLELYESKGKKEFSNKHIQIQDWYARCPLAYSQQLYSWNINCLGGNKYRANGPTVESLDCYSI